MEPEMSQAVEVIVQIAEDRTVPKNIRENATRAKENLLDEKTELNVRVDRALQLLDQISDDPNLPVYTRTQVWNVVTILESLLH